MEREMLDKLIEQEIKIKELKEENFVLKSQLNVEQYYDSYKERIDKAIEYIKEHKKYGVYMVNGNELLNILQGEDKE